MIDFFKSLPREVPLSYYFLIYIMLGILGFIVETLWCSLPKRRFVKRGFLFAPILPIYAYGGILVWLALSRLFDYPYLVFILGVLLTSALEYATSFVMEKLFHMRWWDYSKRKFNLNGRICLRNSLAFGVLSMVDVYLIMPELVLFLNNFSARAITAISVILLFLNIVDTAVSAFFAAKNSELIKKINAEVVQKFSLSNEDEAEFAAIAEEIISSVPYAETKDFVQHGRTSVYEHSFNVAKTSFFVAKKLKLKTDMRSLVRGALLHDFCGYDWHEKDSSHRLHGYFHPKKSMINSAKYFELNGTEKNLILRHMFPLTPIPPTSKEGVIVMVVDKFCATKEIIAEMNEKRKLRKEKRKLRKRL